MPDAVAAALALLAYGAAGLKFRAVRRQQGARAPRALFLTLLALAVGRTFLVPPVEELVNRLTGIDQVGRLLADVLALCTGCGTQAMLVYLTHEEEAGRRLMRPRLVALAAAAGAMSAAFLVARPSAGSGSLAIDYGPTDFYLAYSAPYLAFLAYIFVGITRLCWRYARDSPGHLSTGLRLIAAGGVAGLLYVALRLGYICLARTIDSTQLGPAYGTLSDLTVALVTLLVITGATVPSWAPALARYRDVRQLLPLWRALLRVFPDLAVLPTGSAARDALPAGDLRRRRNRRVIEIRDGQLELKRRLRPDVAAHARQLAEAEGLRGEELAATVEAGRLAVALHEQTQADAPATKPAPPSQPMQHAEHLATVGGGASLRAEVAWLRRVSAAFARSPVIEELVDQQSAAHGLPGVDRAPGRTAARVVTELTAPAPMLVALLVTVGAVSSRTTWSGLGWGLLAALFFSVAPFIGILAGVVRGRLTDHHVSQREQRPLVIVLSVGSFIAGIAVLQVAGAPRQLVVLMIALLAAAAVCLLVTLFWKMSMHMAVVGCGAGVLPFVLGPVGLLLWPVLAGIAWSRVRLQDHTPAQTVAGALCGALVAGGVFYLAR